MANGTLNFLAGIADGFTETMRFKQERDRQDKIAKLQGQLVELQLKEAQEAAKIRENVRETLNPPDPALGFEQPEIIEQKQAQQAKPLLDRLTEAALESGDLNTIVQLQQLQQSQQEQGFAQSFLGGGQPTLPGAPSGAGVQAPSLGGFRPEKLEIGGVTFGVPQSRIADALTSMGIDPRSPEGREIGTQALIGGDARLTDALTKIELARQQEALRKERRESKEAEKEISEKQVAARNKVKGDIASLIELAELNEELAGTAVSPGTGFDFRLESAGAIGLANPETRRLAAKARRFNQLSTQFNVENIVNLLKDAGATISDTKFRALTRASVGSGAEPEANRAALVDLIDTTLQAADQLDLPVQDRVALRRLRLKLAAGGPSRSTGKRPEDLEGFEDLSPKEQEELRRLMRAQ